MRRQKRDPSHRAFIRGYQAGFGGHAKSSCPHQTNPGVYAHWVRGWEEGRSDQMSGFSQFMGQQKVANLNI